LEDGDWDTATDSMSSVNQGICLDAGDMLGWGKAPGRDETSALRTPTSWKASLCHNWLKEQPVLHVKPYPISPQSAALQAMGSPIFGPTPQPHQSHTPPNSHPSDIYDLHRTAHLRSAKLVFHRHVWSVLGHNPQACKGLHNLHSTRPCP
jgi:hypothetical protein